MVFEPKEDITAYEVSMLLKFFIERLFLSFGNINKNLINVELVLENHGFDKNLIRHFEEKQNG